MYYLNHGFMVGPNTIGLALEHTPEIRPDMELMGGALFFEPSAAGFDRAFVPMRNESHRDLVPWRGFVDFQQYCDAAPRLCATPRDQRERYHEPLSRR